METQPKKDDYTSSSTNTDTSNSGQKLIVIKKSKLQKIDKLVFR